MQLFASGHSPGPDVILRKTRIIALLVVPILAAAFLILFFVPESSGDHFAWPIKPRMSAMMLGATYFTGVIYFSVVVRAQFWHQVRLGLLPVVLFASLLGIATILHWDKFSHAQPHFWLWVALYWILPFALLWLWFHNEKKAQPLPPVSDEVFLSPVLRLLIAALGIALAVTSFLLFVFPADITPFWPWTLSALTARVTAAELGLFSLFMLEVAIVARWSQIRTLLFPQLVSPFIFIYSVYASWQDFDQTKVLTSVFIAFILFVFVIGFPAIYFPHEARRKRIVKQVSRKL